MDTPAYQIVVSRCIMAGRVRPADILFAKIHEILFIHVISIS